MKNQCRRGDCLKREAWTVCRFEEGGLERRGWCFLGGGGGGDNPMHTMIQLRVVDNFSQ